MNMSLLIHNPLNIKLHSEYYLEDLARLTAIAPYLSKTGIQVQLYGVMMASYNENIEEVKHYLLYLEVFNYW